MCTSIEVHLTKILTACGLRMVFSLGFKVRTGERYLRASSPAHLHVHNDPLSHLCVLHLSHEVLNQAYHYRESDTNNVISSVTMIVNVMLRKLHKDILKH